MKFSTLVCVILIFVATCVGDAHAQYPATNNRSIMSRLDSIERNMQQLQRQNATGEIPDGVEPSEAAAGSLQVQISELQETINKLRGEFEQLQFQNRQLKETYDRSMKDMAFRLDELEKRASAAVIAPAVETAPAPVQADPAEATIDTSSENNSPESEAILSDAPRDESPKPLNKQEAPKKKPEATFSSPREHYNYAFRTLNAAKYDEAGSSFSSFVKQYPKDPLAGNAFYWLGETHYVRRDYVKAADSFRQGFEALPSGPKAPDNLLKLSMSLNALKRDKEACVVLKQLVAKFGKTSASTKEKAQAEISRIGCQ